MPSNALIEIALQQQPTPSTVDLFWWKWPTDEFAAWGQWAGGVGAIGAVALAWWTIRRDRKKHLREMADAARADSTARLKSMADEEARHAARARAVIAGPGYASIAQNGVVSQQLPFEEVGVEIANYSASPVLEVVLEDVEFKTESGEAQAAWDGFEHTLVGLLRQVAAAIGPGGVKLVDATVVRRVWRYLESGTAVLVVTFTFIDVEGYRWRRVGSDAPFRINADGTLWTVGEVELSV